MDTKEIDALQTIASRMGTHLEQQDGSTHADLADTDTNFHQCIVLGAGNELIGETLAKLHIHMQIFRSSSGCAMAAEAVTEHALILDSILAHDGGAAESAMREHIKRSWQRMRELVAD
jgi:DNA-binding GntR family transcriptional regulator